MKRHIVFRFAVGAGIVLLLAFALWRSRERWGGWLAQPKAQESSAPAPVSEPQVLKLSEQARKNLGLVSRAARPQTYWRTIQIPGVISDRPGISDRGITSPTVGVITQIHALPGDMVRPGSPLFAMQPLSENLQDTQAGLFKAFRESVLIAEQRARLQAAAAGGAISEARLIEINHQARRQEAAIQSFRQELLTRGLTQAQIDRVAEGQFVSTIDVSAPEALLGETSENSDSASPSLASLFEVQELNVELGEQVEAGQLLSTLTNHRQMFIEGHAFKKEAAALARAAENDTELTVELSESDIGNWPEPLPRLEIRHLANSIDPDSRTFSFYVPLENQSRIYEKEGKRYVVWRFLPGQRVRLHVPVEELRDVLVLPAAAVVHEGPETYVFQQNGDLFHRIAVHLLHEDRLHAVIANDGSVTPGLYLAQSSAASLNRVLKAQAASGMRADVHVHADGTVHAAH